MNSADQSLRPAIVAQRVARGFYRAVEGVVTDDASFPQLFQEFIARDQPITVLNEEGQQCKNPRLEWPALSVSPQLGLV